MEDLPVFPLPRDGRCPMNPTPEYARLRQANELPRVTTLNAGSGWLVTRYADALEVLGDAEAFSNDATKPGFPTHTPQSQALTKGFLALLDPPEHTRLRGVVNQEFGVQRVEAMRPLVQRVVDRALDDLFALGPPVDFVSAFAFKVPSILICELLGVPYSDHELFRSCVEVCFGPDATVREAQAAKAQFEAYLDDLLAEKEGNPTDDMLGRFVVNALRPGLVDREELLMLTRFLIVAGFDTTANTMALGTLLFLEHPEQLALLRDDPSLVRGAVEEVLRYTAITHQGRRRVALQDAAVAGHAIRAGEGVIVAQDAANRDETMFPNPDVFDIRRSNARRHVSFSFGIHLCAGAPLARVELQAVFATLFRRAPSLRLAVPVEEVRLKVDSQMFGLVELPLAWDVAAG